MKVNILIKERKSLIELHQRMKPEDRILAFYHHSRLMKNLYESGRKHSVASSKPSLDKHLSLRHSS